MELSTMIWVTIIIGLAAFKSNDIKDKSMDDSQVKNTK